METDRKSSALRQTLAAIRSFHEAEWDCAITLAAASEGMLPKTDAPHLFKQIQDHVSADEWKELDLNLFSVWLKHPKDTAKATISEFEVVIMIVRAITKFVAVFKQSHPAFQDFLEFAHQAGHTPKLYP